MVSESQAEDRGDKILTEVLAKIREAFDRDAWEGITVTVCKVATFGNDLGVKWGARVERPRTTATGRKGKPERVILLLGKTPAAALHQVEMTLGMLDE